MYRTAKYVEWSKVVRERAVAQMDKLEPVKYKCIVEVNFHISRDGDVDNMLKSLFDSIQTVVLVDDIQIQQIVASKHTVKKGCERIDLKIVEFLSE